MHGGGQTLDFGDTSLSAQHRAPLKALNPSDANRGQSLQTDMAIVKKPVSKVC
jgi:hypothetical protein